MRNRQTGNTLLGVFVGIVLGVVIAASVVWFLNRSNNPFNKSPRDERSEEISSDAEGQPKDLPAKPGDKQRFDFYKVLPGGTDAAATRPPAANDDKDNAATATLPNESFFLQAGAFQKSAEADNLKAKLALIGVEASISQVSVPDKGKMFRVRSGPYAKADDMNRVRNQMSQAGIQATVIKIKE